MKGWMDDGAVLAKARGDRSIMTARMRDGLGSIYSCLNYYCS